jgi:hypothetical protein
MIHKIKKQVLAIGFLVLALVAMVGGLVVPAGAAGPAAPNTPAFHIVQGVVQSVAAPSLVVLEANKRAVTLTTDAATQYFIIPMGKSQDKGNGRDSDDRDNKKDDKKMGSSNKSQGAPNKDLHIPADWRSDLGWLKIFDNAGSFSNVAAGDRVIVRADSANLAKQIMIVKGPVNRTIKGTIVLIDPTHVTITPAGAAAITLNVTAATEITLKGQTSVSGNASAVYNSITNNALVVNVQASRMAAAQPSTTLKSIAVAPAPAAVQVGLTRQFVATGTYSNGTTAVITGTVTWASSDLTKATITPSAGLAAGVAVGNTNITAALGALTSPAVVLTVGP